MIGERGPRGGCSQLSNIVRRAALRLLAGCEEKIVPRLGERRLFRRERGPAFDKPPAERANGFQISAPAQLSRAACRAISISTATPLNIRGSGKLSTSVSVIWRAPF